MQRFLEVSLGRMPIAPPNVNTNKVEGGLLVLLRSWFSISTPWKFFYRRI